MICHVANAHNSLTGIRTETILRDLHDLLMDVSSNHNSMGTILIRMTEIALAKGISNKAIDLLGRDIPTISKVREIAQIRKALHKEDRLSILVIVVLRLPDKTIHDTRIVIAGR